MSERIVSDPSLHGWIDDNGKWVWDGQSAGSIEDGDTDGQVTTWSDSAQGWTPDSTVVVSGGNVGIGVGGPTRKLSVTSSQSRVALFSSSTNDSDIVIANPLGGGRIGYSGGTLILRSGGDANTGLNGVNAIQADSSGNVGIGMEPTRSTAKEQLAEWKAKFDARLKAEPKADKKAITLEITDDAFEVLPTEEALAEWMETRAAGDKLQVAGNGSFSGKISAAKEVYTDFYLQTNSWRSKSQKSGLFLTDTSINPTNYADGGSNGTSNGEISLGTSSLKFKDGHFSGTANADAVRAGKVFANNIGADSANCGLRFAKLSGVPTIRPVDMGAGTIDIVSGEIDLGDPSAKFKDGHFSGTVNANKFVGDGSGLTGLPSGGLTQAQGDARYVMKSGNSTVSGTITATDFVATSDERLKDNITTAPRVIDQLHGREWDWKESGEKGSGVVAQELEQVLPHLVHTDDDGMKSVSYNGLVAYLIEEVKALRAEINEMKS